MRKVFIMIEVDFSHENLFRDSANEICEYCCEHGSQYFTGPQCQDCQIKKVIDQFDELHRQQQILAEEYGIMSYHKVGSPELINSKRINLLYEY